MNGRWACLQWRTAVCLLGFVYSVLALFSLLINIKKLAGTIGHWSCKNEKSASVVRRKQTVSPSCLFFFLILSSFWSFYVVVTSMLQQLYGHSRLEAMLLSWQHLVEEEKVSTPCHLQGLLLWGKTFCLSKTHILNTHAPQMCECLIFRESSVAGGNRPLWHISIYCVIFPNKGSDAN